MSSYRRIFFRKDKTVWSCLRHGAVMIVLICAVYGLYAALLQYTGNFHTVIDGELYRSAQPSNQQISDYQNLYGIKTVLNLRGNHQGLRWYEDEALHARALGLTFVDFRMSDSRELTKDDAVALVQILRDAKKPILLHCRSGADRTGLVSALYLSAIAKKSEAEAEGQMALKFGHISLPYLSKAFAMDQSFENLETWLGYPGS